MGAAESKGEGQQQMGGGPSRPNSAANSPENLARPKGRKGVVSGPTSASPARPNSLMAQHNAANSPENVVQSKGRKGVISGVRRSMSFRRPDVEVPVLIAPRKDDLRAVDDLLRDCSFDEIIGEGPSGVGLHLYVAKRILASRGYDPLGSRSLQALLYHCNAKKLPVRKLTLECNQSGGNGVGAFMHACTDLAEVNIILEGLTLEAKRDIGMSLRRNTSLRRLRMVGKDIDSAMAWQICGALVSLASLKDLLLSGCSIGDTGCSSLGDSLTNNSGLCRLDLCSCGVGDQGAKAIASGLGRNRTLLVLNLCDNDIGLKGARALSVPLASRNCMLETISLSGNVQIGDAGAVVLAGALASNASLRRLRMSGCGIGDEGAIALAEAVLSNQCLTSLELRRNDMSGTACARLRAVFEGRVKNIRAPWHTGIICRLGRETNV
jgi:hypothetical protein